MSFCKTFFFLVLSIVSISTKFVLNCLLILPILRTLFKWFRNQNMEALKTDNNNGVAAKCFLNEPKSRHPSGNEVRSRHSSDNGSERSGSSTVSPRPGLLQRSDSIVHFNHKPGQSKPPPYRLIRIQVNKSLRETKLKVLQSKPAINGMERLDTNW